MARLSNIIIHCSDSTFGSAAIIRQWHLQRGWRDIGYHFVICNGKIAPDLFIPEMDGSIETGRPLDGDHFITGDEVGAHALGYNSNSIGICNIGVRSFSLNQMASLHDLLFRLMDKFDIPIENILGHYETAQAHGKTCPNFDVSELREFMKSYRP
ncbi:MAG: N-acetylmuramoyl-L-alanine amidase [Deferribacterales bacterium]